MSFIVSLIAEAAGRVWNLLQLCSRSLDRILMNFHIKRFDELVDNFSLTSEAITYITRLIVHFKFTRLISEVVEGMLKRDFQDNWSRLWQISTFSSWHKAKQETFALDVRILTSWTLQSNGNLSLLNKSSFMHERFQLKLATELAWAKFASTLLHAC